MGKRSISDLKKAFKDDGYDVVKDITFQGKRGLMGESRTAYNYETGEKKRVFYVEGNSYQMGYLMGSMASREVEIMANEFLNNLIPAMINPKLEFFDELWKRITEFFEADAKRIREKYPDDIPQMYADEMRGLVDGCKSVDPSIDVDFDKLWLLNSGVDLLSGYIYAGFSKHGLFAHLKAKEKRFKAEHIRVPVSCNAFSVFGKGTKSGKDHYFGRDFMFINAGVYQDTSCMVIYSPESADGELQDPIPFVTVTVPGFVGCPATMNSNGIGMGVNVVASAATDCERPGFNSILLVRHCAQYGADADKALDIMEEAQRGVSWLYYIVDGANDRAVVVESGMKQDDIDFLRYTDNLPRGLRDKLPTQDFLDKHKPLIPPSNGLMVRWNGYKYQDEYFAYNKALFKYNRKEYNPSMFSERGFIDKSYKDTNVPLAYYFAPQREEYDDLILVTNNYIIPQMRLTMMNRWTVDITKHPTSIMTAKTTYDDYQWRYDELNKQLLTGYGNFDFAKAQSTIDFLNPSGDFPDYYANNPTSKDGKTKQIEGSTSICDLKAKVIKSHFGYYADEWIQVTLPNYV